MGMTRKTAARLAWGLLGIGVGVMGLAVWINVHTAHAKFAVAPFVPVMLGFGIVGALIVSRQPRNVLGWLFLGQGAVLPLGSLLQAYAEYGQEQTPHLAATAWAAWASVVSIEAGLPMIAFVLLLFPHGQLPSSRWRAAGWFVIVTGLVGSVATAIADVNFHNNFPRVRDPVQLLPASSVQPIYAAYQFAALAVLVIGAAAIVIRFRDSRGPERLQLKWVAFASALAAAGFAALALLPLGAEPVLAFILFVPLIPVAAGFAILKYRLYDIDVVINKAVVYGALAVFITGVYVAIVVGVGSIIGQGDRANVALSIVATAVVALAAQPVRARMQRVANRLVYGERATPYEVLTDLADRVGGTYATEDVLPRTARVIAEGTGAARADVWLRFGDELRLAARWPSEGDAVMAPVWLNGSSPLGQIGDADRSTPVYHQGNLLGAISVVKPPGDPLTPAEDKLLNDLAAQAGLVLRNVGLTEELQDKLHELSEQAEALRASRQRIVAAQDAERRRLERNIHDGAQQHLVALAVKLRLAKGMVRTDPTRARTMLSELRGETTEALETLRDLARGIYPPVLEEQGLAAALHAQVYRSGIPVTIEADGVHRHPIETEAAIYFCCLEALQNAGKYANATSIVVRLREDEGHLTFSVEDDGRGFDPGTVARGSGLQNMADRVVALGGDVEVRSSPGRGTSVSGSVPSMLLEVTT